MKTLTLNLLIVFISFFTFQTFQAQTLVSISGDTTIKPGDSRTYSVNSISNSSTKFFSWSVTGGTFSNGRTNIGAVGARNITVTWGNCRGENAGISSTVFNGVPGISAFAPSYVSNLRISKNCRSRPNNSNLTCSSVQNSINATYRYAPISTSARCTAVENIINNAKNEGLNCTFNNPCD